jgi:hypothetical protein
MAKQLTDIASNFNLTLTIAKPIRLTEKTTTEIDQIIATCQDSPVTHNNET